MWKSAITASFRHRPLCGVLGQMAAGTYPDNIALNGKNQITPAYYPLFLKSIHLSLLISPYSVGGRLFLLSRGKVIRKTFALKI
jgi:hypothetical protein